MLRDVDYFSSVHNCLFKNLFGKQVLTTNRSYGVDTVNDFKYSRSFRNYGDTYFLGKNYSLHINWNFYYEVIGEQPDLNDIKIGVNFQSLIPDIAGKSFKTFVKDFTEYRDQFVIKDEKNSLQIMKDLAVQCQEFCFPTDSKIIRFDKDSEKLKPSSYFDLGNFLDGSLPLELFKEYLNKGADNSMLSYVRNYDLFSIISSSFDMLEFRFKDITITNEVLNVIASTFKCKKIIFNSCIIPEDVDFSVLSDRNIVFRNMDTRIYQICSIKGELVFFGCNIDTTLGISQDVLASSITIANCQIDLEKLFLTYKADLLKEFSIGGGESPKEDKYSFFPDFAKNLETFGFYGNLYNFDFLTRFKKLDNIKINDNYYMTSLIIASDYNKKLIRERNKGAIRTYCEEGGLDDIKDDLLPYFELKRIRDLSEFFIKISTSPSDYNELIKYPNIYAYLLSKEASGFDRGYHLYDGFMSFFSGSFEGRKHGNTCDERILFAYNNILGSKLKYPRKNNVEIYQGIGPLIYASDGRPIIFERDYYTDEYYTKQNNNPVYGQLPGYENEFLIDICTDTNIYLEDDKYVERSFCYLKDFGVIPSEFMSTETIGNFVEYLNTNYKDTMPNFCHCFNNYYQFLINKDEPKPVMDEYALSTDVTNKLYKIVYENMNVLSLAELFYVFKKIESNLNCPIGYAIGKYGEPIDTKDVDIEHINEILGINLEQHLEFIEASKPGPFKRIKDKSEDCCITLAAIEEIALLKKKENVCVYKKEKK